MFLDTSGLLCFHHRAEPQHADAVQFFQSATRRLTHSYVLAEFVALSQARKLPRPPPPDLVADLQDNAAVQVVYVSEAQHRTALDFLRQRPDKPWSLCDAVSFLLMTQEGILEALTTDHHFEQAGFVRLLKSYRREKGIMWVVLEEMYEVPFSSPLFCPFPSVLLDVFTARSEVQRG